MPVTYNGGATWSGVTTTTTTNMPIRWVVPSWVTTPYILTGTTVWQTGDTITTTGTVTFHAVPAPPVVEDVPGVWEDPPLTHHPDAFEKARALLLRVLSADERAHFEEHHRVVVTGSEGGRYRIAPGCVGNVIQLDEHDCAIGHWCAHPDLYGGEDGRAVLPEGDVHAAQVLALKVSEARFLRIANLHRLGRCQRERDRVA